ncbi:MAG: hypothetical protein JWM91_582 [Rhodospirillales bacterium]|nr:hypothetical protein [Rhodospirillales bacterium]
MELKRETHEECANRLLRLVGFSLAVLGGLTVVIQLRVRDSQGETGIEGQPLQIGMTTEDARELAFALVQAAEAIESTSPANRPN